MPSMNCCSMCFLNVLVLHSRYSVEFISLSSSFLCRFLMQYKHDRVRPKQIVQGDHNPYTLIVAFCAHKSGFHHNLCILIFACCAHKFEPHHNLYIVIFSCCAHKSGSHHNLCNMIFVFRAYICFVVLTSLNTLHNTLLIVLCVD